MLKSCGPLQSFLSVTVCKKRTSSKPSTVDTVGCQAATDGVGTNGSLLCSSGMRSRLSCCGESVLQMLAQNKAILSWCGDSGSTTAPAIVGGVISMLQMVVLTLYAFATICALCPAPNLAINCSRRFLDNCDTAFTLR